MTSVYKGFADGWKRHPFGLQGIKDITYSQTSCEEERQKKSQKDLTKTSFKTSMILVF
jgi:hypothetical protein